MGSVAHIDEEKKRLARDVHRLAQLGVQLVYSTKGSVMIHNGSESSFGMDVKSKQGGDGVLRYQGRLCVLNVDDLRERILEEAYSSLVHEAIEKIQIIRERLRMTKSRQKSYADVRRRDLEFEVHDWVYLKISPMKGVMRFGKKGKLSTHFVGPFKILRRVGKVAYKLDLPNELAMVHPVFHVSILKKCVGDPTFVVPLEGLEIKENLAYEEVPVEILDRQVKRLRNKEVASVKVLWRNQLVEAATWEAEADMKYRYYHLFPFTPIPA
ncbi:hypothetical protein MTR67_051704 [Solanum verrucosum]|uniref:Tf2-1-like SH3-like domain-containing protein n=1 Tax=Solanum verrucosum TaxID=315347 RepID=A0AAF0V720_SOLVR|nr:hypothetical protein MTR67_051704 [Solanum verrucosum]